MDAGGKGRWEREDSTRYTGKSLYHRPINNRLFLPVLYVSVGVSVNL